MDHYLNLSSVLDEYDKIEPKCIDLSWYNDALRFLKTESMID